MKEDIKEEQGKSVQRIADLLAVVLLPAVLLLMAESLARGGFGRTVRWMVSYPGSAALNYMLWFVPMNLLQTKRRSWCWAWRIIFLFLGIVIAIGNSIKLRFRTAPFVLRDLSVLKDGLNIAKDFLPGVNIPLLVVLGAVFTLALAAFLWLFTRRHTLGKERFAVLGCVALFVLLAALLLDRTYEGAFSVRESYEKNGFFHGFIKEAMEMQESTKAPENYGEATVEELLAEASGSVDAGIELYDRGVNVIVILGEAFMDTDDLTGLELVRDPIPNLHRLMAENGSGYITVKVQGGGTNYTEANVLTGMPYIDYGEIASTQRYLPTLATVFRQCGYPAAAIHSHYGWFYNRYEVMRYYGFETFIPIACFNTPKHVYGTWCRDSVLYQEALSYLKETPGPDFLYVASMETHGGYDYPMEVTSWSANELSKESAAPLNLYLTLLNDADEALARFIDELEARDEPTVVVFFGDHIPALGDGTYEEIGFDTRSPESFRTPYFIWSNCGLESEGGDMPAERLGAYLLHLLGMDFDPWFSVVNESLADDAEDERDKRRELLAKDLLHGEQYMLSMMGVTMDNPGYQIGRKLDIKEAVFSVKDNGMVIKLRGGGWNQQCAAVINGEEYPLVIEEDSCWVGLPDLGETAGLVELSLCIVRKDDQENVINQSNEVLLEIDYSETAKMKLQEAASLVILDIYPGTEIGPEFVTADGFVNLGITTEAISRNTEICVNGKRLATVYGETFISATVPPWEMESGAFELSLYNSFLDQASEPVKIVLVR